MSDFRNNHVALGAMYMCVAMLGGTSIDIAAKALAADFSTAQIVLLRSLFALPIVLVLVQQQVGLVALSKVSWRWQLWRGVLTAGANFGFFYGLAHIELVTALMLAYISPVLIVLLAKPMLGETIGVGRLAGVLVGFAGVVFVIQPTSLDIHPGIWAILGSAVCWALLSLSNRRLAGQVSTPVMTFYTYPVALVIGAISTWDSWVAPQGVDWALFALAGVGSVVAHGCAVLAYKNAAAGIIAPFEYTALIWITLAGYIFWGEIPAWTVWVGGGAVILGGSIALRYQ